jgi:hypothetical protein
MYAMLCRILYRAFQAWSNGPGHRLLAGWLLMSTYRPGTSISIPEPPLSHAVPASCLFCVLYVPERAWLIDW